MLTAVAFLASNTSDVPSGSTSWLLVGIAVVGSSALAAIVTGLIQRQKVSKEAESVAVATATGLVTTLREELLRKETIYDADMTELRAEVTQLRTRLDATERKLAATETRAERAELVSERLHAQVGRLQDELNRYKLRTLQLEQHLTANGLQPPPWPNTGIT